MRKLARDLPPPVWGRFKAATKPNSRLSVAFTPLPVSGSANANTQNTPRPAKGEHQSPRQTYGNTDPHCANFPQASSRDTRGRSTTAMTQERYRDETAPAACEQYPRVAR